MLRWVPRANQPTTISAVRTNAVRPGSIVLDSSHDEGPGDDPEFPVRAERPGVRAAGAGNAGVTGNDFLRDHPGRHARAADHPPVYSLRVLPYAVPHIATWKRRVLREREFSDGEEFRLHGVVTMGA